MTFVDRALVDRFLDMMAAEAGASRNTLAAYRRDESVVLEESIDFQGLPGLSNEIKAKLDLVRPKTLGQAARIEGITPAALTLLAAHARKAPTRTPRVIPSVQA